MLGQEHEARLAAVETNHDVFDIGYMIAISLSTDVISIVEAIEEEVEDVDHPRLYTFGLVDGDQSNIALRKAVAVWLAVL